MAEAKHKQGFLVIQRISERRERMTFHEDRAAVDMEVANLLKQNDTTPPPLSKTDVIVIEATRYTST
jgi:hypothetical protein